LEFKRSVQGKCRKRKRKCVHCKELFTPDPRNRHHQTYCSKPECRKAGKSAAQQKWLLSGKGKGYFSGKENTIRVRQWRKDHPGYWKRGVSSAETPLQDLLNSQDIENKEDKETSAAAALQDFCLLQPALIIGLISSLTGNTLQDDIAQTVRRMIVSGQDIIGNAVKNTP
jgi:hypothetical protein